VARERQRNIEGWVERRRAGTKSAEAARRARESATMDTDGGATVGPSQGEQGEHE
jgi:bifunctional UDP-N-acetylglucosamine pyrophosphorylase / glucosamine-1-phosphate N-acetyltransferase